MVKKATEFSLNELKLSNPTKKYLRTHFSSDDEIVREGRIIAYLFGNNSKITPKSKRELVQELDKHGYIRHDITEETFNVNRLYHECYRDFKNFYIPTTALSLSNEEYELFENPTAPFLEMLRDTLRLHLSELEYDVIVCRFGFTGEKALSRKATVEKLGETEARVLRAEKNAIKELSGQNFYRCGINLPMLDYFSLDQDRQISNIIKELDKIHSYLVFKVEAGLEQRLLDLALLPFSSSQRVFDYFGRKNSGNYSYNYLGLSPRLTECLEKVEGLETVSDIANFSEDNWKSVQNFSKDRQAELVSKMHYFGFKDFTLDFLS
jgi:hypothetical protein